MDGTEPSQEIDSLHSALSKIRHHTNSKLENQKAPAQLLVAIESTLDEQEGPGSKTTGASQHATKERQPAEYFLALESMLDKAQSMGVSLICFAFSCPRPFVTLPPLTFALSRFIDSRLLLSSPLWCIF